MRFDAIRCGLPGLIEKYDQIQTFAHAMSGEVDPMEDIRKDPARMAAMLQRVLDYDAQHPATNPPHFTCHTFGQIISGRARIVPAEAWPTIRHTLRLATEEGIFDLKVTARRAAEKPKTAVTPEPEATP